MEGGTGQDAVLWREGDSAKFPNLTRLWGLEGRKKKKVSSRAVDLLPSCSVCPVSLPSGLAARIILWRRIPRRNPASFPFLSPLLPTHPACSGAPEGAARGEAGGWLIIELVRTGGEFLLRSMLSTPIPGPNKLRLRHPPLPRNSAAPGPSRKATGPSMLSEFPEVCSHQNKSISRDQEISTCLLDSGSCCTLEEERTDPLPPQVPIHHDLESFRVDPGNSPDWLRIRTLLQQLPPQDSDERYCFTLGEEERLQLRLFSAHRRQQALGQGVIRLVPPGFEGHMCKKCGANLKPGEPGVFAARAGERSCWHPDCFTCQACSQALLDLIYFYHKGHLYCGRHHAELLRPRCPACDQLIFSGRCTEAAGRHWHEDHFCCLDCTKPLSSGQYALPGSGPCCPRCFESRLHSDPDPSQPGGETFASQSNDPTDVSSSFCHENRMEPLRDSPEKDEIPQNFLNSAEIPEKNPTGRRRSHSLRTARPGEDGPCPTCSSSSDSEPDGFFLGQPLPQPGEGSPADPDSLHLLPGGRAPGRQCRLC